MAARLRHRNFVKLLDLSPAEIDYLLKSAADLRAAKLGGYERPQLSGKNIALVFEKDSTRTRAAFEIAATDQGAHVTYLGSDSSHMGTKESVKDTARVLGRMVDGIAYRGFAQSIAEELAQFAGVPVWNGLTNEFHPTEVLGDLMAMREQSGKPLGDTAFVYLGDARNNMANSLLVGGCKMGMEVRICAPESLWPDEALIAECRVIASHTGARLSLTDDLATGLHRVDFIHTDSWVSMGEPDSVWEERIQLLLPYQVNAKAIELTRNPRVKFMHCLPAFHHRETRAGEEIYQKFGLSGLEVTDEVFESRHSIVFDQAATRVHVIKAVMVATLGD